jgi:uncharacterized protein (DUF1697 family)
MKYVALLRGINVGGRLIRMADLRVCFKEMGYGNVQTLLQTGNVLFEDKEPSPTKLQKSIELGLEARFNYPAHVQILPLAKLKKVVDAYPFLDTGPAQHDYVIFMEKGLEKQLLDEAVFETSEENVQAGDGVIYWRVDKGKTLKSPFARYLTKAAYRDYNTNRNLNTLRKLVEMAEV